MHDPPDTARATPKDRYWPHFTAALEWIARSERPGGGSAAQYVPLLGWSDPYPETTGYIIPTLLDGARRSESPSHNALAQRFGEWLLSIQNADGSWNGGRHPPRSATASVFNTGQILKGMLALWRDSNDDRWLSAARRGSEWLASGMSSEGLWKGGDYRSQGTPSYYTHVLWPMLDVALSTGDGRMKDRVVLGLRTILARRLPNGVFSGWSFAEGKPAFTHTIAYTIRGIQECARLLGDEDAYCAVEPALEVLVRRAELNGGNLPGAFNEQWKPVNNYSCLTGNAQVARCLLIWESRQSDLRLVSAAARLVDQVCSHQRIRSSLAGVRGGVGGSAPIHGAYMRFRFPNWAAKYLCDAIGPLIDRLDQEQ